ncbi:hypothetical protein BKA21_001742 [Cellulomonas oligotrophica]|uniref:Phenazine biosynthesis protein PhzF n=1 Tax=Cellulomonas oligotrophica TaxID=931536 RepID=A0A7Y9JX08_9CELL|nr:hypothetical protein [Cellulomonas oligotrophica]GIG34294.1 hypothetical protein Col01nite_34530 [Cellulomonas oligotrophica]
MSGDVLRLTAFAADPGGGNPAGVVLDAAALTDADMQRIAAEVGYAETAFVTRPPAPGPDGSARVGIRYFSPAAEVPFCGHATIATAVALAWRDGVGATVFETPAGELEVRTSERDGGVAAAFTSVEPRLEELPDGVLDGLLRIVGLTRADLHPGYPPRSAFADNVHPLVVLADVAALDRKVQALMLGAREDLLAYSAFPVGHWKEIWSTNPLERLTKEVKRRTDVVGRLPEPRRPAALGRRGPARGLRRIGRDRPALPVREHHGPTHHGHRHRPGGGPARTAHGMIRALTRTVSRTSTTPRDATSGQLP